METHENCLFCRRLAQGSNDRLFLKDNKYSVVFAGDHQFFSGYCVVVSKIHVREMHALGSEVSSGIFQEVLAVGRMLEVKLKPWKINYASFGNVIEHLHWHVIPRYAEDPNKLMHPWYDAAIFKEVPTLDGHVNELKSVLQ